MTSKNNTSELITNHNQVLANIKTLISYRLDSSKSKYYKQRLKSGKTFIVEIVNDRVEFAPSKFVGYKNNSNEAHSIVYKQRDGRDTDRNFSSIYGRRIDKDSFLDELLLKFYSDYQIDGNPYKDIARIHYFVKPEILKQLKNPSLKKPLFFNGNDIVKYSVYAGKKYDPNIPKHKEIGNEIRIKLYDKVNYWLSQISVPGYKTESNNLWQRMGFFSHYLWGRINKPQHKDKRIYFTVEVSFDKQSLIYKLDCQRKNPSRKNILTTEQISRFKNYIANKGVKWNEIPLAAISNMNWDELIKRTNLYITKYDKLYEDVIKYVWGNNSTMQPRNTLEEVDPPDPQTLPSFNPSFKGQKVNFLKMQKENKSIGYEGELLVMKFEQERLKNVLTTKMIIEHTSKTQGDGKGYDIKSFDEYGREIFIEVKTTRSRIKETPFNITPTEISYSRNRNKSYWLYRVYNFDPVNRTGKVYRLKGNLEIILDLVPSNYLAVYKGIKK